MPDDKKQSGSDSGRSERDDGNSTHTTTWVNTDAGSIRASYDTDKKTGDFSNAHFHANDKKK